MPVPLLFVVVGLLGQGEVRAIAEGIPLAERLLVAHCTACHGDPEDGARLRPERGRDLGDLGSRAEHAWLERFLVAGEHPLLDPLVGVSAQEVGDLVHFLRTSHVPASAARAPSEARAVPVERLETGRSLFHGIGCVACHAPQEELWERELPYWFSPEELAAEAEEPAGAEATDERELWVPEGTLLPPDFPLEALEARFTLEALADYLRAPLRLDPDGRMPSMGLTEGEAEALAVYLLRDQALGGERVRRAEPGLAWVRFDDISGSTLPELRGREPAADGVHDDLATLPPHPEDHFAFRLSGALEVPRDGSWTFWLTSDDGSLLWLDRELLVDNDGWHAMQTKSATLELTAGSHDLRLEVYEESGGEGLTLEWAGPGVEREIVPAAVLSHGSLHFRASDPTPVDPMRAARGRELWDGLACGACHAFGGASGAPSRALPSLADVARNPAAGCLDVGGDVVRGVPRQKLDDDALWALDGALARLRHLRRELPAAERLQRTLARYSCQACHRRDGVGGPHPERAPWFRARKVEDLGDEGRLPPHLDQVGAKLRPQALQAALAGGRVRPYLETRMPHFDVPEVRALARLLAETDGTLPFEGGPVTSELVRAGRQLVGTKDGLGCVQCHDFFGYRSLGIPAVDLRHVRERLQPGWFQALLTDPKSVNMNTRMPSFWNDGSSPVELFDRDPVRQSEAILAYLSSSSTPALPDGLASDDGTFELDPVDGVRLVCVFMEGVSPRTQLVGFPAGLHVAFDLEHARLAHAWRGRFFNAKGTWQGRAGALEVVPSDERLAFPPGPALARLANGGAAWPARDEVDVRRRGQRYDADGVPTFLYELGDLHVAETCGPEAALERAAPRLRRRFEVRAADGGSVWFRFRTPELDGFPREPLRVEGGGERVEVAGELRIELPLKALDDVYQGVLEVVLPW